MKSNAKILRGLLAFILLIAFIFSSAKPSIVNFLSTKVVTDLSEVQKEELQTPAVTICIDIVWFKMIYFSLSLWYFTQGQGIEFYDEAASNFTGIYVEWMNETLCKKKNITIFTVSDFDLCFESLIFKSNKMVNSVTYYFPGNSTFEPLSVHWNEFVNPSRYLNVNGTAKNEIPSIYFLLNPLNCIFKFACMG